jgi:hypothetical protein
MKTTIQVSDHAVLRYLERVSEIDIDTIRKNIAKQIKVKDGKVLIENNSCFAVVDDGIVTTIYKAKNTKPHIPKRGLVIVKKKVSPK